jgi:hypothetical protein
MQRRIPEAGRIRFGVKTAKAMKAIDTFRFTSHDREALIQIADLYGGDVVPWSDPKAAPGQFELISRASEIRIVLPPDPMGGTPIYEAWGGGGCDRRCDGLTCTRLIPGPDGPEPVDVDCLCDAEGKMACDPRTRLSVILAGVRFGGTWRLETKSWNAAQELPGMVDLIKSLQDKGLTRGVLALKQRRSVVAGQTHQFIVPVLGVEDSIEEITAGVAQVGSLPAPAARELGVGAPSAPAEVAAAPPQQHVAEAPEPSARVASLDDQVIDAELVEDDPPDLPDDPMTERQHRAVHALLRKHGGVGDTRFPILCQILGRDITSTKQMSSSDAGKVIDHLQNDGDPGAAA